MNKFNRFISMLLAVLFLLGAMTGVLTITVSAASTDLTADTIDYENYITLQFNTPEDKLAIMTPYLESEEYVFYVNDRTGETALQKRATGEIIFSNPYDVASSLGSADTKKQLMSQLVVQYTENTSSNNGSSYMYSFTEATLRDQVLVKNIKNGVRVEYVMGLEQTRKLVPRWISQVRFEEKLLSLVAAAFNEPNDIYTQEPENWFVRRFKSFYDLKSLDLMTSDYAKEQLIKTYPIVKKFPIYVFQSDATNNELNWVESYIKMYCPDYTFEEMTKDHEECGYNESENRSPVFKMALEYTLEEDGLAVDLPVNGLRYDATRYTLEYISVLPYMGAGNSANSGYIFYPDGSGALFNFEPVDARAGTNVRGKIYGIDFAYHTITGKYQQPITNAVYGIVEDQEYYTYSYREERLTAQDYEKTDYRDVSVSRTVKTIEDLENSFGTFVNGSATKILTLLSDIEVKKRTTGFFAIIEEGESLGELEAFRAGALSNYNAVRTYFNPRPKDEYIIKGSVSVTSTSSWTVVSDRKYNGNIAIKYMMLSDPDLAKNAGITDSYEPTYIGMAQVYRDYLIRRGQLSALSASNINTQYIPLYVESFGSISTSGQFLSVPITEQKPLTTFDDVIRMYTELSACGVKNINFRLTGFANGGLYYTVPSSVNWDSAVGGKAGFEKLVRYSEDARKNGENLGIYPDFDFAYVLKDDLFDATSLKKHAARTIDGRYASKRVYKTTSMGYVNLFQFAVSPASYNVFYEKLAENYAKYGVKTMSVASLGYVLNSDFDSDDPYNREDNKGYTIEALRYLSEDAGYSLMMDTGNAYTWKYADHLLNVSLDSSRYIKASYSIPFLGIVLHGYTQFSGAPMNMEGDVAYAKLKAIENGANAYFTLSYRNTDLLKEDSYYNQYYSVRYDIWKDDVVSIYQEMNAVLADVQLKEIVKHEFLTGIRVQDTNEIRETVEATLAANKVKEENAIRDAEVAEARALAEALSYVSAAAELMNAEYKSILSNAQNLTNRFGSVQTSFEETVQLKTKYESYLSSASASEKAKKEAKEKYENKLFDLQIDLKNFLVMYYNMKNHLETAEKILATTGEKIAFAEGKQSFADAVIASLRAQYDAVNAVQQKLLSGEEFESEIFEGTGFAALAEDALRQVKELVAPFFTEEELLEIYVPKQEDSGDHDSDQDQESLAVSNDGNIVAVSYGERSEGNVTVYKVFILNYNDFGVKVEYNGITYFIPDEDYVMILVK